MYMSSFPISSLSFHYLLYSKFFPLYLVSCFLLAEPPNLHIFLRAKGIQFCGCHNRYTTLNQRLLCLLHQQSKLLILLSFLLNPVIVMSCMASVRFTFFACSLILHVFLNVQDKWIAITCYNWTLNYFFSSSMTFTLNFFFLFLFCLLGTCWNSRWLKAPQSKYDTLIPWYPEGSEDYVYITYSIGSICMHTSDISGVFPFLIVSSETYQLVRKSEHWKEDGWMRSEFWASQQLMMSPNDHIVFTMIHSCSCSVLDTAVQRGWPG